MDDNDKSNAWDALIEDLGAEPDQSAFERHQPPPQELPPTAEDRVSGDLPPVPQSEPSDWNALAETLGLEVEQTLESETTEEATESTEPLVESTSASTVRGEQWDAVESAEESGIESSDDFLSADTLESDPIDSEEDETEEITLEAPDAVEDLPHLPSQMDQALNDSTWEEESDSDQASAEQPADEEEDDRGISGEAARSAFDALFSDGASTWGSAFLEPAKRDEPKSKLDEPFEDEFITSLDKPGDGADEGDETDRPKRKRSRRRRRGGKGRKSAAQQAEGESASGDDPSSDGNEQIELTEEVSTEDTKKPRRRRSRRGPRSEEAETASTGTSEFDDDFDEDESDGEDRPRGGSRGRTRHRNLPTWSEAIGMIVDANLEQRAKSPSKPQASRGRGSGRGGRGGGRRRKKPESK